MMNDKIANQTIKLTITLLNLGCLLKIKKKIEHNNA